MRDYFGGKPNKQEQEQSTAATDKQHHLARILHVRVVVTSVAGVAGVWIVTTTTTTTSAALPCIDLILE
jgi:hypothetical protein